MKKNILNMVFIVAFVSNVNSGQFKTDYDLVEQQAIKPEPHPSAGSSIIIMAGQSNMDGRNDIASVPSELNLINPRVRVQYNDFSWRQMRPGNSGFAMQSGIIFWGPELSFGARFSSLFPESEQIYLVKSCRGGTAMHRWQPVGGDQYGLLMKRIKKILNDTKSSNTKIVGLVWMQGESDIDKPEYADNYARNLTCFLESVRNELKNPDLPVVIGQVYIGADGKHNGELMQKVHAAQSEVAKQFPRIALVATDDLTLKDEFHYDAVSTVILGGRFADALASLIMSHTKYKVEVNENK